MCSFGLLFRRTEEGDGSTGAVVCWRSGLWPAVVVGSSLTQEREADGSAKRGTTPPVLWSVGMRLFGALLVVDFSDSRCWRPNGGRGFLAKGRRGMASRGKRLELFCFGCNRRRDEGKMEAGSGDEGSDG